MNYRENERIYASEGPTVEFDQGLRQLMLSMYNHTASGLAVSGAVSVKTVFKSEQKSTNCPSSAYHDSDWQTLLVAINMARYQHARQVRDM